MFELTTKSTNAQQKYTLELHRLRVEYEKLFATYTIVLPKINPALIADLLLRESEYDNEGKNAPMYTIEVFTKKGIEPEKAKKYIIQKTGMVPAIYDNGTIM
jgi:hypothetical protein